MSDKWFEADLLDDAIDNLEFLRFLLESDYDARAKWKWIVIATYQALYSFAILAIRGTNNFQVIELTRCAPYKPWAKLLSLYDTFQRLSEKTPLVNDDDKGLEQLRSDLGELLNHHYVSSICESDNELPHDVKSADILQLGKIIGILDRRLMDAILTDPSCKIIDVHEAFRRTQPAELFWRRQSSSSNKWNKVYDASGVPQEADIEIPQHEYWNLYIDSRPLITTPEQDKAFDRLVKEFRNGFVHRRPMIWAIEVDAMVECVSNVLPVIRFLALESNNILYHPDDRRSRTENVFDYLTERLTVMSARMESMETRIDRQLAEQPAPHIARHESGVEEAVETKVTVEKVTQILRDAGLLVERTDRIDAPLPISEKRREEITQRFSEGKPLSEIIIEDRGR